MVRKMPPGWLTDPNNHFDEREQALSRLEPAWAKAAHALRTDVRFGHPEGSLRGMGLIQLHQILEVHRRRFEAGDTLQLLQAVERCAEENVPLPQWLALAYCQALRSFLQAGGPASLDLVFHSPALPTDTPKKAAAARQDWLLAGHILRAVWDAVRLDDSLHSLDEALERVLSLNRFGVGKTKARELFNMAERNQIEYLRAIGSNIQPLSRVFAKRRKSATK